MEKEKDIFVYIRGVEGRGEEVIGTLLKLGGTNYYCLHGKNPYRIFFINADGMIESRTDGNSVWLKKYYTEIFLPKEGKLKHEFKPFERVLARSCGIWRAEIYSHYDAEGFYNSEDGSKIPTHVCVGGYYDEVIPYEGNENLVGTTNNPE